MKHTKLALAGIAALILVSGTAFAQDSARGTNSDFVDGVVGQDVLQTADLDAAITVLQEEIRKNGNDPALLINLGQAYARTGDFARAEESFLKAHNSRNRYDILLANGDVMSTREAAKQALTWLNDLQAGTAIARN